MFGATTAPSFTGFGQQPQQQAQPQQGPFGAGFGQPQTSPFGSTSGGLFGGQQAAQQPAQQQPAFGMGSLNTAFGTAATPAFGATAFGQQPRPAATGFGGFGATAPAFGATQPAFGAAPAPAFGASGSGFGGITNAPSLTGFGVASTPAFGSTTTSAFGTGGAFGQQPAAQPFGSATPNAFGQPATPTFGGAAPAATGAFGQAAPAGGNMFGLPAASAPAFGSAMGSGLFGGGGAFGAGAGAAATVGSRNVAFVKTTEKDGGGTNSSTATTVMFNSISAMPAYQNKSHEELRFEDYQQNLKHGPAQPQQAAAGGMFGQPAAATNVFGQQQTASSFGFGGASAPAFGQAAPSAFGQPAATPGPFGQTTAAPAVFGSAAPATGFGATPAFGQTAAASGFGGFGVASSGAFGQPQAAPSIFGQPAQPAAGGFGGASTNIFGGQQTGTTTTGGMFGTAPAAAAAPNAWGQTSAPNMFGTQPASSPATGVFGMSAPATGGGLFGTPTQPAFGGASAGAFGMFNLTGAKPAAAPTTPNMFGSFAAPTTTPGAGAFGTGGAFGGGGLFGQSTTSPAPGTSLFAPQAGATAPGTFGFGGFGTPGQTGQLAGQTQVVMAAPTVSQSPYGSFPPLPQVPEPKIGISARPVRSATLPSGGSGMGAARASPLASIRSTSSGSGGGHGFGRFGVQLRSDPSSSSGNGTLGGAGSAGTYLNGAAKDASLAPPVVLPTRHKPHRLFIREPPPNTEAAMSPAALTPVRGTTGGTRRDDTVDTPPADRQRAGATQQNGRSPPATGAAASTPPPATATNGHGYTNNHSNGVGERDGTEFRDPVEEHLPHLGQLAGQGYSYEPSPTQLAAMYRDDPNSLRNVKNFTVTRRGVGAIRWLRGVDVTGLRLDKDGIVTINPGEVYCYAVAGTKPPVGEGLNTDAEITLYDVYKRDKETGEPVRNDPVRLLKYEKYLRATCARNGARHVAYKPEGGVWKFEVEHFSRYGLNPDFEYDSDLEDDDLDDFAQGGGRDDEGGRGGSGGSRPGDGTHGTAIDGPSTSGGMDLEGGDAVNNNMSSDDEASLMTMALPNSGHDDDWANDSQRRFDAVGGRGRGAAGASAPLQQTRPGQAGIDPQELANMRDSFFEASAGPLQPPSLQGLGGAQQQYGSSEAGGAVALIDGGGGGRSAGGSQQQATTFGAPLPPAAVAPAVGGIRGTAAGRSPVHNWVRPSPPLLLGRPSVDAGGRIGVGSSDDRVGGTAAARHGGAGGSIAGGTSAVVPLLLRSGSPSPSPIGMPDASRPPPALRDVVHSSGLVVDAGLSMGRSFRVGWGPNGMLARIDGETVTIGRVLVEGVDPSPSSRESDAGGSSRLDRLRARLSAALELHLRYSHPLAVQEQTTGNLNRTVGQEGSDGAGPVEMQISTVEGASGDEAADVAAAQTSATTGAVLQQSAVPQWVLRVDRRQVAELCEQYMKVCMEQSAALSAASRASGDAEVDDEEPRQLQHEVETWRLMQLLYQHLEGEGVDEAAAGDDDGDASMDDGRSAPGTSTSRSALAIHERRAALSGWLRLQAKPRVEAALQTASSTSDIVLQLLSGHQLAAAAAAAAACGDVRLATLCAQAGVHAASRSDAAAQLDVWREANMEAQIDPSRLQVYRLLAGRVADVQDTARFDWRRYLGVLLWYGAAPNPPAAGTEASDAVASAASVLQVLWQYNDKLIMERGGGTASGAPPPPLPHYLEGPAWAGGPASVMAAVAGGTTDVQWELLRLWSATEGGRFVAPLLYLAPLLRSAGHSDNVCESSLSWHLLTTLQAVGGAPSLQEVEQPQEHVAAFVALIGQLELVGGMSEWAVYVALHLPDHSEVPWAGHPAGGARGVLVAELLSRHCGEWVADDDKRHFLLETLKLPPAMLADAEAVWAAYHRNSVDQGVALLAAGRPREAHAILVDDVLPALFLADRYKKVASLVDALRPYRDEVPDWSLGVGLYCGYLELSHLLLTPGSTVAGCTQQQQQYVTAALAQVEHLTAAADAVQARYVAGATAESEEQRRRLTRLQMVLSRMAVQVHEALITHALASVPPGDVASGLPAVRAVLQCGALPADVRSFAVAACAAHTSAFACA